MRRITRYLLWLFVFSVPCGIDSSVPGIGTITRLLGIMTLGAGMLTVVVEGRIRKPGAIFWFAAIFAAASFVSLIWTVSFGLTVERSSTYIQFVGLIWLVGEFAQSREEQHALRLAFCVGGLVFVFSLLRNFAVDAQLEGNPGRYSATGINPNFVGFVLVSGLPMAWNLFLDRRGTTRLISVVYCVVAPLTILLTASRSASLALLVTAAFMALTIWHRPSQRFRVVAGSIGVMVLSAMFVPQSSWNRLLTTTQELEGDVGTVGGRSQIWAAGLPFAQSKPLLGAGAGTFQAVIEPVFDTQKAAHNMPLSLLVEQGVIGVLLFAGLLTACARTIATLPSPDRQLGAAWMIAWFVFAMSHDSHTDRVTWVVIGILAAQERVRGLRSVPSPATTHSSTDAFGSMSVPVPTVVSR